MTSVEWSGDSTGTLGCTYGRRTRSSSTTAGVLTYAYGPSGMREKVTVESAEGTATTTLVWAGTQLVMSRTVTGGGGKHGTDTTYRYVYGPDSLPLELIVDTPTAPAVSYAYLCDRAGSVVGLTDKDGALVATYAYDPWGAPLNPPTTGIGARNPLRYRGYYYDVATALYYLPARYYDPAVARFLSPDPASPSAGDPLSLNRYAYCVGDPVNADDPSGAIMDSDGNGRLDPWDHNLASAKATAGRTSAYYGAKAKVAYYSANGTAQQLVKAQVALYNITGWPRSRCQRLSRSRFGRRCSTGYSSGLLIWQSMSTMLAIRDSRPQPAGQAGLWS